MNARNLFVAAVGFGTLALEMAVKATPVGVPEPEVGFGIAAAVALGAGYTWLKRRIDQR